MASTSKTKFRIFCTPSEAKTYLPKSISIAESYPAFIIVEALENEVEEMRKLFPLEKLATPKGPPIIPKTAGLADTIEAPKLRGPYLLVVRFIGPVKKEWIAEINQLHKASKVVDSLGSNTLVVKCPSITVKKKLEKLEKVSTVSDYQIYLDLSEDFLRPINVSLDDLEETLTEESKENDLSIGSSGYLTGKLRAKFFENSDREVTYRNLKRNGIRNIGKIGDRSLMINLYNHESPSEALKLIVKRFGIKSLTQEKIKSLKNDVARELVAGNQVFNPRPSIQLSGQGEVIAIADTGIDTGDPNTIHLDFRGRMRDIQSFPIVPSYSDLLNNPEGDDGPSDIDGHGTHVCGSAAGDGARSRQLNISPIEGLATQAEIVFQSIDQTTNWNRNGQNFWRRNRRVPPARGLFGIPEDLSELFQAAYDQGARIHSNSWGGGNPGEYDNQCFDLDEFVFQNQDLLIVVAAGNDGRPIQNAGRSEIELSSITSPGTAKNCITVGACENERPGQFNNSYGQLNFTLVPFSTDNMTDTSDDIAAFSSRGPCTTGRRKPDVVAPGTFILSTKSSMMPNNPPSASQADFPNAQSDYRYDSGTSMATPIVAGCAALIREYLRIIGVSTNPSAALVKGALIHSSEYIPYRFANRSSKRWADNEQGWGRVHLPSIISDSNQSTIEFHDISTGLSTGEARSFPITVPSNASALRVTLCYSDFPGEELINNLNLFAFAPDNSFINGNDFDLNRNIDSVNNVEGIIVENPMPGNWNIRVIASSVIEATQTFALITSVTGIRADHSETSEIHPFISSALPNPEGGDSGKEWVEFTNPSNSMIDLNLYTLSDRQGGLQRLEGALAAGAKHKFFLPSNTQVKLNNSGDDIMLLLGERMIHKVTYRGARSGQPIIFDSTV